MHLHSGGFFTFMGHLQKSQGTFVSLDCHGDFLAGFDGVENFLGFCTSR